MKVFCANSEICEPCQPSWSWSGEEDKSNLMALRAAMVSGKIEYAEDLQNVYYQLSHKQQIGLNTCVTHIKEGRCATAQFVNLELVRDN